LSAKYLRAQGRLLEAAEVLETALGRDQDQGDEHESILCDLIDVLEESGNMARLRRTLERIDVGQPTALARAGLAWLWLGEFRTAAVRSAKLARTEGFCCTGSVVLLVAAAMLQRPKLVERVLGRLRRGDDPIDPEVVADTWCRGLMGSCSPNAIHGKLGQIPMQDSSAASCIWLSGLSNSSSPRTKASRLPIGVI